MCVNIVSVFYVARHNGTQSRFELLGLLGCRTIIDSGKGFIAADIPTTIQLFLKKFKKFQLVMRKMSHLTLKFSGLVTYKCYVF